MSDDWRIRIAVPNHATAEKLADALGDAADTAGLAPAPQGRVIVSVDDDAVFAYANDAEQARRVAAAAQQAANRANVTATPEIARWHPEAEEWEDPSDPLPTDPATEAKEHAERIASEDAESDRYGFPEWEVKVTCDSHADTRDLARQLEDQGIPSVRRWRYLLVGARDEDAARALAQQIEQIAPSGSTLTVEESMGAVWDNIPPNPYAVFGGLGA